MKFPGVRRLALGGFFFSLVPLSAQTPFQFPTANHALYKIGSELKFLAPTSPDRSWTSGSFGCVRSDGWQMHEGLDIRSLQHDRHGEPTDPVLATADVLLPKDIPLGQHLNEPAGPSATESEAVPTTEGAIEFLFNVASEEPALALLPWLERAFTLRAMQKTGDNQVRAAKLLGITRATLRKRLDRNGKGDGV